MTIDWTQTLLIIASIMTVSGGLFAWLRSDSNKLRDEIRDDKRQLRAELKQLREDMQSDNRQLREEVQDDIRRLESKVDDGFRALDDRLRVVETEQSRVAGLLEGLGLSGVLPGRDS